MRQVYVICNSTDPLGVFNDMEDAFLHARKFSHDWTSTLRVIEVDHPTGQASFTAPPRLVGMFRSGRQVEASVRAW